MYIDRIDLTLPQEDLQSVLEAFASAADTLELLPSVGPVDRKRYAKLGLKNEALTLQIIEVGRKNRHLIPAGIDFEKIDRDLVAREQLRTLKVILQGLLDRVSDSMLLTGVDLYAAALSMYHCLRRNADTASLRSTVAELKKGFARPSRKKKEAEQPVAAPAALYKTAPEPISHLPRAQAIASVDSPAATIPAVSPSTPDSAFGTTPARHLPYQSVSPQPQASGATVSFQCPRYDMPVFLSGGFLPAFAYGLPATSPVLFDPAIKIASASASLDLTEPLQHRRLT